MPPLELPDSAQDASQRVHNRHFFAPTLHFVRRRYYCYMINNESNLPPTPQYLVHAAYRHVFFLVCNTFCSLITIGCDVYHAGQSPSDLGGDVPGFIFNHAGRFDVQASSSSSLTLTPQSASSRSTCAASCANQVRCEAFEFGGANNECFLWIRDADTSAAYQPSSELDFSIGKAVDTESFAAYTKCEAGEQSCE